VLPAPLWRRPRATTKRQEGGGGVEAALGILASLSEHAHAYVTGGVLLLQTNGDDGDDGGDGDDDPLLLPGACVLNCLHPMNQDALEEHAAKREEVLETFLDTLENAYMAKGDGSQLPAFLALLLPSVEELERLDRAIVALDAVTLPAPCPSRITSPAPSAMDTLALLAAEAERNSSFSSSECCCFRRCVLGNRVASMHLGFFHILDAQGNERQPRDVVKAFWLTTASNTLDAEHRELLSRVVAAARGPAAKKTGRAEEREEESPRRRRVKFADEDLYRHRCNEELSRRKGAS